MKKQYVVLLLMSSMAFASNPPVSGIFSNAPTTAGEKVKSTLDQKFNLLVTVNSSGQQFFIQCIKGDVAGFGVVTTFKKPVLQAVINAGPECPASTLHVDLDYEEALIRSSGGYARLARGNIYVPFKAEDI